MKLDQALLGKYVGGEFVTVDRLGGRIYRGEIARIEVWPDGSVVLGLAWLARAAPVRWPRAKEWWWSSNFDETIVYNPRTCRLVYFFGRFMFLNRYTGVRNILIPPHGSKLDQRKVLGTRPA